ncbi:MAG: asparagine synthase (glutamine-hydrolyzing) [Desulfomonile tiedjei]|nr:asparagine synthase (glutamine-hydrolyzing) [Desulfomonile tiedjei]
MCGINGGWVAAGIEKRIIEESLDAMRHRGPDDTGLYQQHQVFLGNRRLSIIDLEGGHQPVFNEDGTLAVVFNGEIYNYRELMADLTSRGHIFKTQSDTEVLVHLYEQCGVDMCRHLRGMFAFAVWDSVNRLIYTARDRFGKKPLYYTLQNGNLLFASELKALRILGTQTKAAWQVRDQGVYDFLSLAVIPQPDTIYDKVYALPPGSWMVFDGRDSRIAKYWTLEFQPKLKISYPEVLQHTRELVGEAVRLRLRSDVPLAVFLSGGIDSSVIAYEASRSLGESLQTFTVAMGDADLDESTIAGRTARALGVRNNVLNLEPSLVDDLHKVAKAYDQPYADPSAIPTMKIAKLAAQHVKVVLNGDGGDELFAGYRRYLAARYLKIFSFVPRPLLRAAVKISQNRSGSRQSKAGFVFRFLRALIARGGERYLIMTVDTLRESTKAQVWIKQTMRGTEDWIESLMPTNNIADMDALVDCDLQINLLSDLLVKMDMASMAASLEARSPLMDHEIAEFSARLPASYRLRFGRTKAVLRDAYRDRLPDEVINRAKSGFDPPLLSWLKNEMRPLTMDCLLGPTTKIGSYVDRSFVKELLQGRTAQDCNWALLVYSLLILELWLQEFA